MEQSINTKVDLEIAATLYVGTPQYGKLVIGDAGFEFVNKDKHRNSIQLPWTEVDYVIASTGFRKGHISRYTIQTKRNVMYPLSSKNPNKVLRTIRQYVDPSHLVRAKSLFDVFKIHC